MSNQNGVGSIDAFKAEHLGQIKTVTHVVSERDANSYGTLFTAGFAGRILRAYMFTTTGQTNAVIDVMKFTSPSTYASRLAATPTCASAGVQSTTGAYTDGLIAVGDVIVSKVSGQSSGKVTGTLVLEILMSDGDTV